MNGTFLEVGTRVELSDEFTSMWKCPKHTGTVVGYEMGREYFYIVRWDRNNSVVYANPSSIRKIE